MGACESSVAGLSVKAAKPTGASRAALGRWAAAKSIGATATAAPPTSVPLSQSAV